MPAFKFISLNDPLGSTTSAFGLNNAGDVVGSYNDGSGPQGFRNGSFATLNDPNLFFPPGEHFTTASGINDAGTIAGYSLFHAFVDDAGTFTTIAETGATRTVAEGINAAGQVVGSFQNLSIGLAGGNWVGFIFDQGHFTEFSDPLASSSRGQGTFPQDINDAGQVVGFYTGSGGIAHGFLFSGGVFTDVNDPLGTNGTFATGINNAGEIVGYFTQADGQTHSFVFSGGNFTTVDDRHGVNGTFVTDVNDVGQLSGYYRDTQNVAHGFIAQFPGPFDNPSWGLTAVSDFNGDHKADLAFSRLADNLAEIQFQDGAFAAGGGTVTNSPFDASWHVVTAADFNHDGKRISFCSEPPTD